MRSRIPLAIAIAGLLLPAASRAQSTTETATERIRLNVYGMGSFGRPAYGFTPRAAGFAVGGGAGFTVPHLHHIEPSLDLRYTYLTNQSVTETVFAGGLRVAYHAGRFHPYGDLMVGSGNINFKEVSAAFPEYTHDNSLVYSYGGGADVDVTRTLALRLDVQEQHWRLSDNSPPFYPLQGSVGIRYQFHFRNKYGPE